MFATEDVDIRLWASRWGRGIAAFTPGRLLAALERECLASGGQMTRASTYCTALSQHCICGARAKKPLSQRWHSCTCGAEGDRDLVSALLAACVTVTDPDDPKTARLDPALREHARALATAGLIKDFPSPGRKRPSKRGHCLGHHPPQPGNGNRRGWQRPGNGRLCRTRGTPRSTPQEKPRETVGTTAEQADQSNPQHPQAALASL